MNSASMRFSELKSVYLEPVWTKNATAWAGHIPLAFWIVEALRPRTLVELGTYAGASYFAFCQSVTENSLATECFAVDTWKGDQQAGFYGAEIFEAVAEHNQQRYRDFSSLLRMTFDQARGRFENSSIDLLHIDGLHTYEAARHDFESWLPKLSERAVVLFHDIAVKEKGFGVWRLWQELSAEHEHVEFAHSNGMGVLFVGSEQTPELARLLEDWKAPGGRELIQLFFERLGGGVAAQAALNEKSRESLSLQESLRALQHYVDQTRSSLAWKSAAPVRVLENSAKKLLQRWRA